MTRAVPLALTILAAVALAVLVAMLAIAAAQLVGILPCGCGSLPR